MFVVADSPTPSASKPSSNTYIPPKDLYSFPPNSDAIYPGMAPKPVPSSGSSYLPQPSGAPDGYPSFVGPVSPDILASFDSQSVNNMASSGGDDAKNAAPDHIPTAPASQPPSSGDMDNQPMTGSADDQNTSMDQPPTPQPMPMPMGGQDHDHSHDHHHHDHDHLPYLDHDPSSHGHDFDSYPYPSDHDHFTGLHGIDHYPEIVYDHDYFDHHHHHPPPPTTTTTTTEEPEEEEPEPEQPRVKKYSYFYLSRSLWYIPLYFTVWFTFYVTWLILQSIGRHKVNNTSYLAVGIIC